MIDKIMLDMDGVLTNFHQGVALANGKEYKYDTTEFNDWDFWKQWGVETEDVFAACDSDFWENLQWMHDGRDILNCVLKHFDIDQVYLLTNPIIGGTDAATGKMKWIQREIPDFFRRVIVTCAPKGLLAKNDVLLIDDFDHNIDNFKNAGGQTIQICRPWNKNHHSSLDALTIFEIQMRKVQNAKRHTYKV